MRMEQAREAIADADLLYGEKSLRSAMNRAYYGAFYAGSAMLAARMIGTSKHSGLIAMISLHFIKPGLVSPACGKALAHLLEDRILYDYKETAPPPAERVEQAIQEARTVVEETARFLEAEGYGAT